MSAAALKVALSLSGKLFTDITTRFGIAHTPGAAIGQGNAGLRTLITLHIPQKRHTVDSGLGTPRAGPRLRTAGPFDVCFRCIQM